MRSTVRTRSAATRSAAVALAAGALFLGACSSADLPGAAPADAPASGDAGGDGPDIEPMADGPASPESPDVPGSAAEGATSGDEDTCTTLITYGALVPLSLIPGSSGEVDLSGAIELLVSIEELATGNQAETEAVHDAAVDVGAAAADAAAALEDGGDPEEPITTFLESLEPLGAACTEAGVTLE
ncbi:hypothetical protein [Blastococcus sp. SYSU D00820]